MLLSNLPAEFIERFLINAGFILILLRMFYFSHSKDRDSLFGFFLFGHGVYLVTGLMHEVNISMGFAFGLFAVLSMLRYRTEAISIRDMTYLFLVIVMSLMAAVGPIGLFSLAVVNTIMLAIVWLSETHSFAPRTVQKTVTYDNTKNIRPENRNALHLDLQARLGESVVDVDVKSVDFVRDVAVLRVTLAVQNKITTQSVSGDYDEKSIVREL